MTDMTDASTPKPTPDELYSLVDRGLAGVFATAIVVTGSVEDAEDLIRNRLVAIVDSTVALGKPHLDAIIRGEVMP